MPTIEHPTVGMQIGVGSRARARDLVALSHVCWFDSPGIGKNARSRHHARLRLSSTFHKAGRAESNLHKLHSRRPVSDLDLVPNRSSTIIGA